MPQLPKADASGPQSVRHQQGRQGRPVRNRSPAITQFDRADTNKDGILSVEEQRARAKAGR
jgi:hypothetical protein